MDNRLATFLKGCIRSIFEDGKWMYIQEREWKRDLTRLLSQLDSRGLALLTLDLPALCKHLDRCLDEGSYSNPSLVLTRPKRKADQVPVFLRSVFLRVFTHEGKVLDNPCVEAVLFLRTVFSFAKKLRIECSRKAKDEEIKNFFKTDASLRSPSLRWDLDDFGGIGPNGSELRKISVADFRSQDDMFGASTSSDLDADHYQRCFDIVASQFGLADFASATSETGSRPRHGPGAVAEGRLSHSKYNFDFWPAKLQSLFPYDYFALPSLGCGFSRDDEDVPSGSEPPARLIAVPKTQKGPRLIAAEPVAHQWIQQLLLQELEVGISRSCIADSVKLRRQDINAMLALQGSKDGSLATIDLSEASDRVSLALVERFWRANYSWLSAFHACRSRYLVYRSERSDIFTMLKKFAPMGSACTFPMQSIIFATICIATAIRGHRPTIARMKRASLDIQVYGDDIVVPTHILNDVVKALTFFGLRVNVAKTYSGSSFRESCGIDAFNGWVVTPPRLKEVPLGSPAQTASLLESSNNFHKAGFWYTARYISSLCSKELNKVPVSRQSGRSLSLFSFVGENVSHLASRWNPAIQQVERRVFQVTQRTVEADMKGWSRLTQYFTELPSPFTKWRSSFVTTRTMRYRPGWVPEYTLLTTGPQASELS